MICFNPTELIVSLQSRNKYIIDSREGEEQTVGIYLFRNILHL